MSADERFENGIPCLNRTSPALRDGSANRRLNCSANLLREARRS